MGEIITHDNQLGGARYSLKSQLAIINNPSPKEALGLGTLILAFMLIVVEEQIHF